MKSAKRRVLLGVAAIGVMVLFNVPAHAQSSKIRVKIPFAFHAAETALPAGTYTIERRGDAIRISDRNGHTAAVLANAVDNDGVNLGNRVVFNRYGDTLFLSEVRWTGYSSARHLITSSAERELGERSGPERVLRTAIAR